jgi:small subunit ribosomal protein S17e
VNLGNVRPEKVKRVARELYEKYPTMFTTDFEQNKKILAPIMSTPSKGLKNMIIGYVTRLVILNQPKAEPEAAVKAEAEAA